MTKTELLELKERLKFVETHGFQVGRAEAYAEELEKMGAERASEKVDASCLLMMVNAVLDGNVKVTTPAPAPAKEEAPAKLEEAPAKEEAPKAEEPAAPAEEELKAPENHSELDLGAATPAAEEAQAEEAPKAEDAEAPKADGAAAEEKSEAAKPAKPARQSNRRSS